MWNRTFLGRTLICFLAFDSYSVKYTKYIKSSLILCVLQGFLKDETRHWGQLPKASYTRCKLTKEPPYLPWENPDKGPGGIYRIALLWRGQTENQFESAPPFPFSLVAKCFHTAFWVFLSSLPDFTAVFTQMELAFYPPFYSNSNEEP